MRMWVLTDRGLTELEAGWFEIRDGALINAREQYGPRTMFASGRWIAYTTEREVAEQWDRIEPAVALSTDPPTRFTPDADGYENGN
jgi:hypothetical protein